MSQNQDKLMQLIIASPDGEVLNVDQVDWINTKLSNGYPVSIYANHAPLVALTAASNMKYRIENKVFERQISAGILSVNQNLVRFWVDCSSSQSGNKTDPQNETAS